jgi:hypothetical protein
MKPEYVIKGNVIYPVKFFENDLQALKEKLWQHEEMILKEAFIHKLIAR